jgi:AP-1 complex subunit beta-1
VICVAKLYDLNQSMFLENGFLELLQDTVNDANPMVVANAIQALTEIHEAAPELNAFDINGSIHTKLLVALNECTEYYPPRNILQVI